MTAAHCFYGGTTSQTTTIDNMSVVLGVHDRSVSQLYSVFLHLIRTDASASSESSRKNVKIAEIIIHESYNPSGSENDIALLKLAESIDLDTWSPACLPDQVREELLAMAGLFLMTKNNDKLSSRAPTSLARMAGFMVSFFLLPIGYC